MHESHVKEYEERLENWRGRRQSTKEHSSAEDQARKTKLKLETEVVNWVKKYDTDMNEKQELIDTLNKQYDTEKAELRKLANSLPRSIETKQMKMKKMQRQRQSANDCVWLCAR